jgi:hypothetical protein
LGKCDVTLSQPKNWKGTLGTVHSIESNAWFSGFSDSDGSFYVRRANKSKNPAVSTVYKLELASIHKQTEGSLEAIMNKIADYLNVNLLTTKSNTLRVQVESINKFQIIVKYFSIYPLLSNKYFNFLVALKIHNIILNKQHLTEEGQALIKDILEFIKK